VKTIYTATKSVKIQNANGTAGLSCGCGSWIKHWEILTNKNPDECSVFECIEDGTEGAHVTRPNVDNEDYKTHPYIVPMCKSHNGQHGVTFTSKANVAFA